MKVMSSCYIMKLLLSMMTMSLSLGFESNHHSIGGRRQQQQQLLFHRKELARMFNPLSLLACQQQQQQQPSSFLRSSSSSLMIRWMNNNNIQDSDDFYEQEQQEDDEKAGYALAHEFYEQLKIREMRAQLETSVQKTTTMKNLDNNEEEEEEETKKKTTTRRTTTTKFTGRQGEIDSTGTPSAGLFAQSDGTVYGFPVESRRGRSSSSSSVQEQMMRSEFNLVSFAGGERSILLQLSLALALLGAVLYIGFTGGITDGSERFVLETDEYFNDVAQTIITTNENTSTSNNIIDEVIRTSQTGSIWL